MGEIVFVLLVVLLGVTLVGHGIWVFVAFLFRALSGHSAPRGRPTEPARMACPFCDHSTPAQGPRCDYCGRPLHGPLANELADLQALDRQLTRF